MLLLEFISEFCFQIIYNSINCEKDEVYYISMISLLFILDMLIEFCEESTAKIPSDHIELALALLQLIDEWLCLSSLLYQLVSFVNDFFKFYK